MAGVSSASDSSRDGSGEVVVEEEAPLDRVCDVLVAVVVVVPVVSR